MKRRLLLVSVILLLLLIPALMFAQAKPGAGMYFRLVTHGGNDPFWAVFQKGMIDAASELGCKATIDLAGSDMALQEKDFQEAVAQRPDGIALVINDDKAWDKPVADAIAKGIPVIGVNNDDTKGAAGNARLCYIGQDERHAGLAIGRAVFAAAKAKGWDLSDMKVACAVEVAGANYGVVRSSGIMEAMKEYGISGKPDIVDCTLDMTTAEQRITSYIIAHPDVKLMFGLGGICTDRLTSGMKNAGKKAGDILGGGFDAAPGTLTGLETGYMVASIDQQQYLQGYFSVYVLYLIKKYDLRPNIDTGGYLITKDNIALIKKLSPMHVR
jgi:simple sugar transport system substrate-binding protein